AVASSVEVYALRALSMACALLLSAAVDALSLRGALPLCPGGGGRRGPVRRIDRAAGRFRLPAAGGGDGAGRRAARTGRRAGRRLRRGGGIAVRLPGRAGPPPAGAGGDIGGDDRGRGGPGRAPVVAAGRTTEGRRLDRGREERAAAGRPAGPDRGAGALRPGAGGLWHAAARSAGGPPVRGRAGGRGPRSRPAAPAGRDRARPAGA